MWYVVGLVRPAKTAPKQTKRCVPHSRRTASDILEEGGDDVKSAWPLWAGPHTCYNGNYDHAGRQLLEGGTNLSIPGKFSILQNPSFLGNKIPFVWTEKHNQGGKKSLAVDREAVRLLPGLLLLAPLTGCSRSR